MLDSSYRPIDVVNWQRAICLDLFDKARLSPIPSTSPNRPGQRACPTCKAVLANTLECLGSWLPCGGVASQLVVRHKSVLSRA